MQASVFLVFSMTGPLKHFPASHWLYEYCLWMSVNSAWLVFFFRFAGVWIWPNLSVICHSLSLYLRSVLVFILKISLETGEPFDTIQEQAREILDEMGHSLKLSAIRVFALSLSKIFKRLYGKVFCNMEGIQKVSVIKKVNKAFNYY